jgi:hypothetical protein
MATKFRSGMATQGEDVGGNDEVTNFSCQGAQSGREPALNRESGVGGSKQRILPVYPLAAP